MPDPGAHPQAQVPEYDVTANVNTDPGYAPPPSAEEEEEDDFVAGQIDYGAGDSDDFMDQVQQEARRIVGGWAKAAGYSSNAGQAFVNSYWPAFTEYAGGALGSFGRYGASNMDTFQVVLDMALSYLGARMPFDVDPGGGSGSGRRGSGGRRGGGGPRGPTPDEIRAQFDLDALAERVNEMSRVFLIQDHENPRSVANQYVEAIVKNPEQKLDFDTFVKNRLRDNPRWNVIMQNKPNGMDESMYVQRYVQQVQQVMGGGDESTQVAFEQAALGSSASGVQDRLGRSRAVRSSSNFVNTFEDQIRNVSELLR